MCTDVSGSILPLVAIFNMFKKAISMKMALIVILCKKVGLIRLSNTRVSFLDFQDTVMQP